MQLLKVLILVLILSGEIGDSPPTELHQDRYGFYEKVVDRDR